MAKQQNKQPKRDIYQEVTDRIVELLEQGTPPWRQPIKRAGGDAIPKSLASGKTYRGINVFLLAMTAWAHGYDSSYWATFRQVKQQGGMIRKGEKATLVVFWKQAAMTDKETGEELSIPVLRHYNVFNADQCEGVTAPDQFDLVSAAPFVPIEAASRLVAGYRDPPTIEHGGSTAAYFPGSDRIKIADPRRFESRESYYATLFHELVHYAAAKIMPRRDLSTSIQPRFRS